MNRVDRSVPLPAIVLATVLAFASSVGHAAHAQEPRELTLRYRLFEAPDAHVWRPAFEDWAAWLSERADNRLRLIPARDETPIRPPGDSYAGAGDESAHPLLKALHDGAADLIWMRPGDVESIFPRLSVFELPYMVHEPVAASRAIWEFVQVHMPEAFGNLRLVALHVNGPVLLHLRAAPRPQADTLCVRPLLTGSRWLRAMFDALECGRTAAAQEPPEPMSYALPFAALQSLHAHAAVPPEAMPALHIESMPGHPVMGTRTHLLLMSPAAFDALPDDLRPLLDAAAGPETSAWFATRMQRLNDDIREIVAEHSAVRFATLDEMERLRIAAEQVRERWLEQMRELGHDGQPLLDGARTLIRQHTR